MRHVESVVQIGEDIHLLAGTVFVAATLSLVASHVAQRKCLREIETDIEEVRTRYAVLWNAGWPVIDDAILVVVFAVVIV